MLRGWGAHTHTHTLSISLSIYNMLNYTAGEAAAGKLQLLKVKESHSQKAENCKCAPNELRQLPDKYDSIMRAVCSSKQSPLCAHWGFDLGAAIWCRGLRDAAFACLSRLLYVYEMRNLNGITCGLSFFFFFLSLWVTPDSSYLMDLLLSLLAFSFQASLPLWPQTFTLVTLIHNTVGKYASSN